MKKKRDDTNTIAVSNGPEERWRPPGQILANLDHEQAIDESAYKSQLREIQTRLLRIHLAMQTQNRPAIIVVEGPDAAGKGGAIKRMLDPLDPRRTKIWLIGKPAPHELARHYLWRFWTRLPTRGDLAVFDRSWYGRVLVERVEGFASKEEWRRAYREINEFERTLADDGVALVKIWLHVTAEEQLRRFERRLADPLKAWKIGNEDWRNRKRWKDHLEAAESMFELTSTAVAPWHVVPGNYKWYARVQTLRVAATGIEAAGISPR